MIERKLGKGKTLESLTVPSLHGLNENSEQNLIYEDNIHKVIESENHDCSSELSDGTSVPSKEWNRESNIQSQGFIHCVKTIIFTLQESGCLTKSQIFSMNLMKDNDVIDSLDLLLRMGVIRYNENEKMYCNLIQDKLQSYDPRYQYLNIAVHNLQRDITAKIKSVET